MWKIRSSLTLCLKIYFCKSLNIYFCKSFYICFTIAKLSYYIEKYLQCLKALKWPISPLF